MWIWIVALIVLWLIFLFLFVAAQQENLRLKDRNTQLLQQSTEVKDECKTHLENRKEASRLAAKRYEENTALRTHIEMLTAELEARSNAIETVFEVLSEVHEYKPLRKANAPNTLDPSAP